MSNKYDDLENKVNRLIRVVELLGTSLQDIREQIETRKNLDQAEGVVLKLAKLLKCRKPK